MLKTLGCVAACWLAVGMVAAQEESGQRPLPTRHLGLDPLERLSWPELEQLYRASEAGALPAGYARGRTIYCSGSRFVGVKSRMTRMLWHGKVFDLADCTLVNQWCGFRAIKARVYYGPSWLDGKTSIIMDYQETSKVWANVRDEVREVAPGVYLGLMYHRKPCEPQFKLYFALETCLVEREASAP